MIRRAPVNALENAQGVRQGLQVAGEEALLTVEPVARYKIRQGREIDIDPFPNASETRIRLFLLGSALGVLCHQRGLLPLHANAILVNGRAIAFAGDSGVGKSTLAAYFQAHGYAVLNDDVCVVRMGSDGTPLVWPGLRRLKLWRDAAGHFGHDGPEAQLVAEGVDKLQVPLPEADVAGPFPLARVYVLEAALEPFIQRLKGAEAMKTLMANTYRNYYLPVMGLMQQHFRQTADLATQVAVFRAVRRRGFDIFDAEAARLEKHMLLDDIEIAAAPAGI